MSLHMFKKLRVIRGDHLWRDTYESFCAILNISSHFRYALVLFENQNLRQLFNTRRQPLRIVRGKVSMQNNRMLCYSKIDAFLGHVGLRENVTENDVSKYSNGDKAICKYPLISRAFPHTLGRWPSDSACYRKSVSWRNRGYDDLALRS